jgi:hypothetical protein
MEQQCYCHPDWHDLAKESRKHLDGWQESSIINARQ